MKNLVSIITPTFNSVESTLEAVVSVQAQTYEDWELWIIDDGSEDENKLALAAAIRKIGDSRINYLPLNSNQGVAVVRNRGIEKSRGRYIAFLDCDDLWDPEKLTKHLQFIEKTQAALSFTSYLNVDDQTGKKNARIPSPTVNYKELLKFNIIGNSTAILDTSQFDVPEIPKLRRRQDFAFWLKILKMGHIGHGLQEPLTERRILGKSLSSNKFVAAKDTWKMYRTAEEMSIFRAAWYFSWYVTLSLRERFL